MVNDIFKRYSPDFKKLKKYGFKKDNNNLKFEKIFKDNMFKAVIIINSDEQIITTVYDIENDEEYLPLRIENNQGSFVSEIRTEYEKILTDIRDKCFIKKYYIYPQSNRITNLIIQKYGNKPEFLWEKFSGSGIFRNQDTQKWYAAILDVDRSKLQSEKKGLVEVIDLKLSCDRINEVLKEKNIYKGYHMNKKSWISIILDETVSDNKIMELIEESHKNSYKK